MILLILVIALCLFVLLGLDVLRSQRPKIAGIYDITHRGDTWYVARVDAERVTRYYRTPGGKWFVVCPWDDEDLEIPRGPLSEELDWLVKGREDR